MSDGIATKDRNLCRMKIRHMAEKEKMCACEEVFVEKKVVGFDNQRKHAVSKSTVLKIGLVLFFLGWLEELRLLIENIFQIY